MALIYQQPKEEMLQMGSNAVTALPASDPIRLAQQEHLIFEGI